MNDEIKQYVDQRVAELQQKAQYDVPNVPFHVHNGTDSPILPFNGLVDVPHTYSGQSGKVVTVNTTESGLSFTNGGGAASITVKDGITTVNNVATVKFTGGATVTNPGGNEADVAISSSGVPAGANTQVQYNHNGVFGGAAIEYTEPSGTEVQLAVPGQTAVDTNGVDLNLFGGAGNGTGRGSSVYLIAGAGGATGEGGEFAAGGGQGGAGQNGGRASIGGGNAGSGDAVGGDMIVSGGSGSGNATGGPVVIVAGSGDVVGTGDGADVVLAGGGTNSGVNGRIKFSISLGGGGAAYVSNAVSSSPSAAATDTLDLTLANEYRITMPAGNITIAAANAISGQKFLVSITQDSVGSRTVTWFTTIKWAGGVAPTLTTTANKRDTFGFICTTGSTYDGFVVGQNI